MNNRFKKERKKLSLDDCLNGTTTKLPNEGSSESNFSFTKYIDYSAQAQLHRREEKRTPERSEKQGCGSLPPTVSISTFYSQTQVCSHRVALSEMRPDLSTLPVESSQQH